MEKDNKVNLPQPVTIGAVDYTGISVEQILSEDDGPSKIRIIFHGADQISEVALVWVVGEAIILAPTIKESSDAVVGKTAKVKIASLPGSPEIDAVVDTGATTCSLHADNFVVNNDQVKFTCPAISPNTITMHMAGLVPIRSPDGGAENRPSIKVDLIIDGREVPGVIINLNNRGHMATPFLLGMNALQSGNFVVDPGHEDSITENQTEDDLVEKWDLIEMFKTSIPLQWKSIVRKNQSVDETDFEINGEKYNVSIEYSSLALPSRTLEVGEVSFRRILNDGAPTVKRTDSKHFMQVFSIIYNGIQEKIGKLDSDIIVFSAKRDNDDSDPNMFKKRIRIYYELQKRIKQHYSRLSTDSFENKNGIHFLLIRPNVVLTKDEIEYIKANV